MGSRRRRDPEWGPAFWRTNAYGPFPIGLWLNGHEWAKRQMEKVDVNYEALDNGFLCADPAFLQKRCDQLGAGAGAGAGAVRDFFWRWYWRLPSPFTKEDLDAGHVYELAFRQFVVSDSVSSTSAAVASPSTTTGPILPLSPGRPERNGFEYDRHGTLLLYAGREALTELAR